MQDGSSVIRRQCVVEYVIGMGRWQERGGIGGARDRNGSVGIVQLSFSKNNLWSPRDQVCTSFGKCTDKKNKASIYSVSPIINGMSDCSLV